MKIFLFLEEGKGMTIWERSIYDSEVSAVKRALGMPLGNEPLGNGKRTL